MFRVTKPINRFLIRLTVVLIAAGVGLYAGLSRSSTKGQVKETHKVINKTHFATSIKNQFL